MFIQFAFLDFGAPQLVIILAIALLLFGGKRLPELSRGLGESMRELRKAASGANDLKDGVKEQVSQTKDSLVGEQPKRHDAKTI